MHTNKLTIGILAHVDSGKTTLAESMLFLSGSIRKPGRVDHRDAFLDTYELERTRGITIFSKQALFKIGEKEIFLLDTPGHVDFSAEMERTLQVLDYAILVVSGTDGVQGHTQTLWRLLKRYDIPVFVFINKMDQPGNDRDRLLREIQEQLDFRCIPFDLKEGYGEAFFEAVAMCDEGLMEQYLERGILDSGQIREGISARRIFPCFFGSALKQEGVEEFLRGMETFTVCREYPEKFAARVYKIARDEQNNRLTYMKITGGCLRTKMVVESNDGQWREKADGIRIYSGKQFTSVNEAEAGTVCAVTGLSRTFCGEGLGLEEEPALPILEPVLRYKIILPSESNAHDVYGKLRLLEEEEPALHITWDEASDEMHAQVMGAVQIEILKSLIYDRFHVAVEFGMGNIVYKETIAEPAVGIGHFEPLKHYAEVHVLLEPLERGSGLVFATDCSEDILDRNWQRLILTHLEEKRHRGVLTGSEITDMRITLMAGRAHQKHTEGGDFRQATYRAVRQGLKEARSILLEPVYAFRLELPKDMVGRAMTDIQKMNGVFEAPVISGDTVVLNGTAPVVTMRDYPSEVAAYSRGYGRLSCRLKGYEVCHNAEAVVAEIGYDSERDADNPTGSVFCAHGAGFYVDWEQVPAYAHVDSGAVVGISEETDGQTAGRPKHSPIPDEAIGQEEIDEIFLRTFGNLKKKRNKWGKTIKAPDLSGQKVSAKPVRYKSDEEYLLVDGYNIIFAWEELRALAQVNIDSARDKLMDMMCNYQGYKKNILIIVFDAYKVSGGQRKIFDYHNIHVVYTKEAETADQYIEKVTHRMGGKYRVTVATSDRLEQMIVWGQGANRLSAAGLKEELDHINSEIRSIIQSSEQD
ncbi:MAG: TetM/TetW/TetO/TetS family tetracycline resistance ribosomal protection protein [Roseburia sp.]|nr:TetM/TetW/TetO/TetS family tetracycline resistance ribosomal protection protein [Roseburia sp.]